MYKYIVLLFCALCGIHAQYEIGDSCDFDQDKGTLGTCEVLHKCEYAKLLLYENEIHPPMCSWMGKTRIVCCPKGLLHETGVFSRYFLGSENGIIKNEYMTCRYSGYLPMICCPNQPNYPPPPEPRECPPLPPVQTPKFTRPSHEIAWRKCVENRRYVDICEQDLQDLEVYNRTRVCNMNHNALRITSHLTAGVGEFPHMAALGCHAVTSDTDIVWVGGGSLISDKFILTAGHVLVHNTYGRLRYALLGVVNKTDIRNGELYNIVRLIPHKRYTTVEKHDDIALLELDRQVKLSEFIRPICLPIPGMTYDNTRIIAGWGDVGAHAGTSQTLLKAYINEVGSSECKRDLRAKNFMWNDESMICAKGRKAPDGQFADSCEGDSGGPLMSIISNKNLGCSYVVNGVVSWGPNCGTGTAGAYTRVSAYIDWIVSTVWPSEYNETSGLDDVILAIFGQALG